MTGSGSYQLAAFFAAHFVEEQRKKNGRGNHGLFAKGPAAYEDITRVPLLIRHPQGAKGKVYRLGPVSDAVIRMQSHPMRRFEPIDDHVPAYQALFEKYRYLYEAFGMDAPWFMESLKRHL